MPKNGRKACPEHSQRATRLYSPCYCIVKVPLNTDCVPLVAKKHNETAKKTDNAACTVPMMPSEVSRRALCLLVMLRCHVPEYLFALCCFLVLSSFTLGNTPCSQCCLRCYLHIRSADYEFYDAFWQ